MVQIFVSYSRVDTAFVELFIKRLQRAFPDLKIWHDQAPHGLIGGGNWWNDILSAIAASDVFIYILSNESVNSVYCQAEFTEARRLQKRIITVQARDRTELTDDLDDIQFINMKDGVDSPEAIPSLVAAVNLRLKEAEKYRNVRPLWKPATPKPDKETPPTRADNAPDVTTPALSKPADEVEALRVQREAEQRQTRLALLGIGVTIVVTLLAALIGLIPWLAERAEIAATQAALALTSTELFISNSNATSTAWQFAITETAAYATLLALSATPTETPRPTDTPDPLQATLTPVTSNADWTPVERDFNGVTMVLVPAGSFEMGSTPEEIDSGFEMCQQAADNNAECQRSWFEDEAQNGDNTQTFNEPFWIDRTEVTRAQYQVCIDAGICEKTPDSDFSTEDDQPINRVTWFQAQTYCEWREARLPTEAEWEYAARGPERFIFPWGNEFDGSRANHCDSNCGDADWASSYNYVNEENDDGFAMTSPVASYPEGASWVGATDMAGNVWEWTSSLFEDYPYDEADGRERDTGDSTDVLRVLRGGSFNSTSYLLRSANRLRHFPDSGYSLNGFRCARS